MTRKFWVQLSTAILICGILVSGCGPTLTDTKVQYVKATTAATSAMGVLNTLKDAKQLTPADVNKINPLVIQFEMYRSKVRADIDANIPAPAADISNLDNLLDALILIEIEKAGVK